MTTESQNTSACGETAGVGTEDLLAMIGEDGWVSPTNPPDTDRTVQLAWEDMSYGPNSLGFYDGIAEIPDSGRRFWWSSPPGRGFWQIKDASLVGAWRELSSANNVIRNPHENSGSVTPKL